MNNWYLKEIEEIYKELNCSKSGLTNKEVKNCLERDGYNELPKKKRETFFQILIRQFLDPILIILFITIIVSLILGEYIDAIAIAFILVLDLILGTVQEWNASKNAAALSDLIKVQVKVLRNGKEEIIDSNLLVRGDVVLFESGNKVSADIRIIECHNLTVNESVLTGESIGVVKSAKMLLNDVGLPERRNMLFASTSILTGRCVGIVVDTGINTEIGKIALKVTETRESKSPLAIRMEKFSSQITIIIGFVALFIALVLLIKDFPLSEIFLSVVALSVSAMPEGLPLALTMALTIASNRMTKKNVIVKKLNAVESLGSCTVIASDKTGTLTVNQQVAKKIVLPNGEECNVGGVGYNGNGKLSLINDDIIYLAKMGYINNEASLEYKNKQWVSFGDSIDIAFLALGKKVNVDVSDIKVVASIPYESQNKYSAIFFEYKGEMWCTVKGSMEKILEFVSDVKDDYYRSSEKLAEDGYRVIGIATGKINNFKYKEVYDSKDISNLKFNGMVGFIDPIREDAKSAIVECSKAGIKVVMITGDHPLTAFAIGRDLSLISNFHEVATGDDIDKALSNGQRDFEEFVSGKRVFARVTPIQKLEIVEAYKRMGEFVAVTGDGVNDAPALKAANIGVAMGSGTDVAIETSSMIITDDRFSSIVEGIKEGRTAYSNVRKVSYMLLSCGFAEVLFFLLAIFFNLPMPLVAIQLLWLNVVTDGLQDFALSFERMEKGVMEEKPRKPSESLFNKELAGEIAVSGFTIGIIVFVVWYFLIKGINMDVNVARGYIMVLMVFMQNMHVLNCRSEKHSFASKNIPSNVMVIITIVLAIILQIVVMEVDVFSKFLQTSSMPPLDIVILFLVSTIILMVMEIYKRIRYPKMTK